MASAVAASLVTVPLPQNTRSTKFNDTARKTLKRLAKHYPDNKDIRVAYNTLDMVIRASPSLPATRFFNEVYTRRVKVSETDNPTLLELIRRNDLTTFCRPDVISQFSAIITDQTDALKCVQQASRQLKDLVWRAVKKLVLYSGHPDTGTVTTSSAEDDKKRANATHFNQAYLAALEEFAEAFPCERSNQLVAAFNIEMSSRDLQECSKTMHRFKEIITPLLGKLITQPLLLCETPDIMLQLPYIGELPLAENWQETVLESEENMNRLGEHMFGLMMAVTGLHNINSNILSTLQQQTEEVGSTIQDPTDRSELYGAATTLLKQLQQNRSFQSVSDDVKSKMPMMDGELLKSLVSAVCPEEFEALRSGGLDGLLTGSTGVPAFGDDAPHPAWDSQSQSK